MKILTKNNLENFIRNNIFAILLLSAIATILSPFLFIYILLPKKSKYHARHRHN